MQKCLGRCTQPHRKAAGLRDPRSACILTAKGGLQDQGPLVTKHSPPPACLEQLVARPQGGPERAERPTPHRPVCHRLTATPELTPLSTVIHRLPLAKYLTSSVHFPSKATH